MQNSSNRLNLVRVTLFLVALVCSLNGVASARAEEAAPSPPSVGYDLFLSKGMHALNKKQYDEAVATFRQALVVRPRDLDATYGLGVALNHAGKDAEAEQLLEEVARRDPGYPGVHFELGVVNYDQGKDARALEYLKMAERADPDHAMIYYYQGLILHRMEDFERSSPRFLRAVAMTPELGLTAHFYAGVGFYRRGIFAEAKDAFEETIRIDPRSPIAESAREFLEQIEGATGTPKRWEITLSTAYQYDSNVILLPGDTPLPAGISGQWDHRMVIFARAGYKIWRSEPWTVGTRYGFYQNLHEELTAFNVQNHQGSLYIEHLGPSLQVRLPYEFNFALVDTNTYLRSHAINPIVRIPESAVTYTELQYGYASKDFVNTATFPGNDARDGVNHRVEIAQAVLYSGTGLVRVGYAFDRELTGNLPEQDDWDYRGHKVSGHLRLPAFQGIRTHLQADYHWQDYTATNSFSSTGEKREDRMQTYTVNVSRGFGDWFTLTLQYLFRRNDSNVPAFDYDRSVYSVILSGDF